MYDLHRLRLLRELSLRGTLAAVAEALGYDPSSISHQLSALEREVGVRLLEHVGRGVRLTPAAQTLVAHTDVILLELERAEAAMAASSTDIRGTVRIATIQTAARTLVVDAMERLQHEHPNLSIAFEQLNAEQAIPALIARDFDLVISEYFPGNRPLQVSGVKTLQLADDQLSVAMPSSWNITHLRGLADRQWIMEPQNTPARAWSVAKCRAAGFEPHVAFETADVFFHAELVERGLAAAFLPARGPTPASGVRLLPTGDARTLTLSSRAGTDAHPAFAAVSRALIAECS